jgi:hypothetical protein
MIQSHGIAGLAQAGERVDRFLVSAPRAGPGLADDAALDKL